MVLLDLSKEEQKAYLKVLAKYEKNELSSIPKYESFEWDFNVLVDRFNSEHYYPKVSKLMFRKNISGYSIIGPTLILALINIIKERESLYKGSNSNAN